MRIFITGANGFLGKAVTAVALEHGHQVKALVRKPEDNQALASYIKHQQDSLEIVNFDLREAGKLTESLADVDLVIHLAARKEGDFYDQFEGTVVATERLISAMETAGVNNLVGISTFSVYEYSAISESSVIDEFSLLVQDPTPRDEYCQTKLLQEDLYHKFGKEHNLVVIRPGMIFGPGELWHGLLGSPFGSRFLRIGSKAVMPMTFVNNCAEAIILAAEQITDPSVNGEVFNIVDNNLPTQRKFWKLAAKHAQEPPSITIPWRLWRTITGLGDKVNKLLFDGKVKLPGLLVPTKLDARFKPLKYDNQKAQQVLGWKPNYGIEQAIAISAASEPDKAKQYG